MVLSEESLLLMNIRVVHISYLAAMKNKDRKNSTASAFNIDLELDFTIISKQKLFKIFKKLTLFLTLHLMKKGRLAGGPVFRA